MKLYQLIVIFSFLLACYPKTETQFDMSVETGLTEDEFYAFLNSVYASKLDSFGRRVIYAYAGRPIKIEYENGAPTELEPPTMPFLEAKYRLDSSKLKGFKLISSELYSRASEAKRGGDCTIFNNEIGEHMFFIHLPWYNPKDNSLLFKDVDNVCPPHYHDQGVFYRFEKGKDQWILIN